MRTATRFLTWTCLVLASASSSFAQTAPAPASTPDAPAAAPADSASEAAPAPEGVTTADPYGAPAEPPAEPAVAPAEDPAPQPAPLAAPTAAPAYTEPPLPAEPEKKCALDKFCFGPVLTLGILNPIGFGVHGRIAEHFGFGIDYQFMPSISIADLDTGFSLFSISGRWHVSGSPFFLSLGFSYQSLYSEGTLSMGGDDVKMDATVSIPQIAFGFGVLGGSGFVMGIDLSLGIPLGGGLEFNSTPPDASANPELARLYADRQEELRDFVESSIELLPMTFQLNLLRIGYIF